MFNLADHIKHYRTDAEEYDYFEYTSPADRDSARRIQEAVLHASGLRKGEQVLDAGSGNGWLARNAAESDLKIVAVDIGLRNLQRIKESASGAMCVCASLERLPFRPASFDKVICSEVLEHVNDPDLCLRACADALKPNGLLAASTPYKEKIKTSLCIHCNRPTPANAHLHSFDEKRLFTSFEAAGLGGVRHTLVMNRFFLASGLSWFLRALPYAIWRIPDVVFNLLAGRATTLVATAVKSENQASNRVNIHR